VTSCSAGGSSIPTRGFGSVSSIGWYLERISRNSLVPGKDLAKFTREKAQELRDGAPVALRWVKEAIALAERGSLEEVLDFEEGAQLACFATEDRREGIRAFLEKRRPVFKGK
jgi:enoyl-CoA hydratase